MPKKPDGNAASRIAVFAASRAEVKDVDDRDGQQRTQDVRSSRCGNDPPIEPERLGRQNETGQEQRNACGRVSDQDEAGMNKRIEIQIGQ